MKIVFGLAFAIATVIQLWACYRYHSKIKAVSKGFLMLTLLGFYLFSAPAIVPWIVAALLFSFIGDMLLLRETWLTVGGISFFSAHLCYILAYLKNIEFSKIPMWLLITAAVAYGILLTIMMRQFKGHVSKRHFLAGLCYLTTICTMSFVALLQLFTVGGFATLVYTGTLLFIVSDFVLLMREFRNSFLQFKHKYTIVMFTYIFAQAFIVYGMMYI